MAIKINTTDLIHHIEECTQCDKDNIAPNGYSRTPNSFMIIAIMTVHKAY